MDWREQGRPCNLMCRWCDGPRTRIGVGQLPGTCAHACIKCDTSEKGDGSGPPKFVTVWELRKRGVE